MWSPRGDQIFYTSGEQTFVAVDVAAEPEFRAGSPQELFDAEDFVRGRDRDRDWDVSQDGERFVAVLGTTAGAAQEINVVVNWFEELKERVPVE